MDFKEKVLAFFESEIHKRGVSGSDWLLDHGFAACGNPVYWFRDLSSGAGLPGPLLLPELYVDSDEMISAVTNAICNGATIYDPGNLIEDEHIQIDWEGIYDENEEEIEEFLLDN